MAIKIVSKFKMIMEAIFVSGYRCLIDIIMNMMTWVLAYINAHANFRLLGIEPSY